jgi:tetratricopeptide (TPR) repeat protein
MHIEIQEKLQHLSAGNFTTPQDVAREVSRFSPVDFRFGIQWLLAQNNPNLAQALAEAGLSLHPNSEDILAISGLLAMTREDWPLAIELLQDLVELQQEKVQPMTCQMLARAWACNLDIDQAHKVLQSALKIWPENETLIQEIDSLALSTLAMAAAFQTH